MNIPSIKKLVEGHSSAELQAAEKAILEEIEPVIEVAGEDEGEKLTHVMAALWVKTKIEQDDVPLNQAIRDYTLRVRNSIS